MRSKRFKSQIFSLFLVKFNNLGFTAQWASCSYKTVLTNKSSECVRTGRATLYTQYDLAEGKGDGCRDPIATIIIAKNLANSTKIPRKIECVQAAWFVNHVSMAACMARKMSNKLEQRWPICVEMANWIYCRVGVMKNGWWF